MNSEISHHTTETEEKRVEPTADKVGSGEPQPQRVTADTPTTSRRTSVDSGSRSKVGRPPTASRWEDLKRERANSWSGNSEDIREFLNRDSREGKRKQRESPGEGPEKRNKIPFTCIGKESPVFRKSTITARSPPESTEYGMAGERAVGGSRSRGEENESTEMKSVELMLQMLLKRQDETTDTLKQMKEDAKRTREQERKTAEDSHRELKKDIAGLTTKIAVTCESWLRDRAELEERIKKLEKEREEWTEKESRWRREWEKKTEEKMVQNLARYSGERVDGQMDKNKVEEIEHSISRLERENEKREKEKRKRNVIVRGQELQEAEEQTRAALEAIEAAAGGRVEIEETQVITGERGDMVVVKIKTWETKMRIMRGKRNLGQRKICIDDDLTRAEREIRRKIATKVRELNKRGLKARAGYKKMWVNNISHAWCERTGTIGACYDGLLSREVREEAGNWEEPGAQARQMEVGE